MPLDTILAIAGAVSALLLIAALIAGIISGEGNRSGGSGRRRLSDR